MNDLSKLLLDVESIIKSNDGIISVNYCTIDNEMKVHVTDDFYDKNFSKYEFKTKNNDRYIEKYTNCGGIAYYALFLNNKKGGE